MHATRSGPNLEYVDEVYGEEEESKGAVEDQGHHQHRDNHRQPVHQV